MNQLRHLFHLVLLSGLVVVNFWIQPVSAVAPEDLTVLLSDSRPSTVANWTITHDQEATAQLQAADTLVLTLPTGFSVGSVDQTDIDFKVASTDETLQTGACGATDTVRYTIAGQVMTFDPCDNYTAEAAGSIIEIEIGLHALFTDTGNAQITNHATPATYTVTSDTSDEDAKDALIAVVSGVTVSATVDESLTVAVNAVSAGAACDDNGGTPTEITTTATTVPFATVATEAFYNGCQRIDVDTNAAGGYTVTVAQTQLLTSGANTIAEGTCDGACNDTTLGGWETATNNGFAYCADDRAGNAGADAGIAAADQCDDATPLYYTFFTDPTEPSVDFMFSSGPVSGDQTNVSFHLSVPGDQSAGTYQNVIYYVATPTF